MEPFSIYTAQKSKGDPLYCGDCCTTFTHGENIVLVVSDGVSSCINDHKASNQACQTIEEYYRQSTELSIQKLMFEAVKYASRIMNSNHLLATAIIVTYNTSTNHCFYTNIGDTRLYHYDGLEINCLTEDDNAVTIVQQNGKPLFVNGSLVTTNKGLTKALGDNQLEPNIKELILDKNESLILITDGISGNGKMLSQFFDFIHKENPAKEISNLTIECSNSNYDDATMMLFRRNDFDSRNLTKLAIEKGNLQKPFFGHSVSCALRSIISDAIQKEDNNTVLKCLRYTEQYSLDIADLEDLMSNYAKMPNAQANIFNYMHDLLCRFI